MQNKNITTLNESFANPVSILCMGLTGTKSFLPVAASTSYHAIGTSGFIGTDSFSPEAVFLWHLAMGKFPLE